ncbi:MAG: tRNA (adenosine(37)-N6)-threonylcarbamoyltransferase complex dimerization subunit type 1 TsaB [Planctomycetota bacterium]|nr:MAG: tRNA (adenosine(37)-N6)-threonylcarbamoyltransferase complex dimerization subunit type 1 TsaB [Planctomycetota bacterium]
MDIRSRRILAIETSGRMGSVALGADKKIVGSSELSGTMQHAAELMPTVDRLLKKQGWPANSITDVFVSIGPGSFTGLRIGVTVARTLAWSIGARIVAVPTVDALARNALEANPLPEHVAVILDAKRRQIYAAAFDIKPGRLIKTIDAHLSDPADFFARCPQPLALLGEGIDYHGQAIDTAGVTVLDKNFWPGRAENVFHVGLELADQEKFTPGPQLMPLYIRRPEAEEKWEKLHGIKPNNQSPK